MVLSEEQIEHFYREGYVVVPGLVPAAEIDQVLAAAPPEEASGGGWQAQIFSHAHPEKDAALHRLLVEPNIVGAVRQIFANEPRVLYGMLAVVPARGGNGLPWHQDNQYEQVLGGALNVFVALSPITPEAAILWVAPQSHRQGTQPWKENIDTAKGHREALVEPENGVPLPAMKPGDVCIFDRNTYHRSLQNATDRPRFAYAAQYQAQNARVSATGKINSPEISPRPLAHELRSTWLRGGLLT
jgi:ectoine hydroxylase-related dioxygenase (phytanoyl-CoA dioxygenase family)